MILKRNRFHGHNSLRYVYSEGKVVRGQLLSIKSVGNSRRKEYRCAVVVSKKVSKSAVVRNRIRRRVYELIRGASIAKPADIVVTVFSEKVADMPHAELQKSLYKLLNQAGITD